MIIVPVLGQHVPLEVARVGGLVATYIADAVEDLVVDGLLVVLDEAGPARPVVAARVVAGKVFDVVMLRLDVVLQVVPPRRPEVAPRSVAGEVLFSQRGQVWFLF